MQNVVVAVWTSSTGITGITCPPTTEEGILQKNGKGRRCCLEKLLQVLAAPAILYYDDT